MTRENKRNMLQQYGFETNNWRARYNGDMVDVYIEFSEDGEPDEIKVTPSSTRLDFNKPEHRERMMKLAQELTSINAFLGAYKALTE